MIHENNIGAPFRLVLWDWTTSNFILISYFRTSGMVALERIFNSISVLAITYAERACQHWILLRTCRTINITKKIYSNRTGLLNLIENVTLHLYRHTCEIYTHSISHSQTDWMFSQNLVIIIIIINFLAFTNNLVEKSSNLSIYFVHFSI